MSLFPPPGVVVIGAAYRHLVDGISVHGLLSQVHALQRHEWSLVQSHKVLVYLADHLARGTDDTRDAVTEVCRALLPTGSAFRVAVADPDHFQREARPRVCLVWGLTAPEAGLLSRFDAWSLANGLTMFTLAWDAPPSPFIASLMGFTAPPSPAGRAEVEALVRNILRGNTTLQNFVTSYHDNIPLGLPPTLDTLLREVEINTFTVPSSVNPGTQLVIWNLHVRSPTAIPDLHRAWRDLVTCILMAADEDLDFCIVAPPAFICAMCRATSHPASRCPFPAAPGWNGPSRNEVCFHLSPAPMSGRRNIAFSGEPTVLAAMTEWFLADGTCVETDL